MSLVLPTNLSRVIFLALFLLCLCLCASQPTDTPQETGQKTGLPARRSAEGTATTTRNDVQNEIDNLPPGGLLQLNSAVALNAVLVIQKPIRVQGTGDEPTLIKCTSGGSAMDIRSGEISIENLIIEDCDSPAVALRHPDVAGTLLPPNFNSSQLLDIRFEGITFQNNGNLRSFNQGGALSISPGWNVSISNCQFVNNTGDSAGAVLGQNSILTVEETQFTSNNAIFQAGAISFFVNPADNSDLEARLHISRSTFSQNENSQSRVEAIDLIERGRFLMIDDPTPSGGTLLAQNLESLVIDNCRFVNNSGMVAGGAMTVADVRNIAVLSSKFETNQVGKSGDRGLSRVQHGGGLYIVSSVGGNASITDSSFIGNRGGFGGGVHVLGVPQLRMRFKKCTFEGNVGSRGGGAAIFRAVENVEWSENVVRGNMGEQGGGLLFTNGAGGRIDPENGQREDFVGNHAVFGGAILLSGSGGLEVVNASFVDNSAIELGGAISVQGGILNKVVSIQFCRFKGNLAAQGGAISVNEHSNVRISGAQKISETTISSFVGNHALDGGAIFAAVGGRKRNFLQIENGWFEGNRAYGTLDKLMKVGEKSFGVLDQDFGKRITVEELQAGSVLRSPGGKPYGIGCGGAICVGTSGGLTGRKLLMVTLRSLAFVNNEGKIGGAVMMVPNEGEWFPRCLPETACQSMSIFNATFRSNRAYGAGGGVFFSDMRKVFVAPEVDSQVISLSDVSKEDLARYGFDGNTVSEGGYGEQVASDFASVLLESSDVISEDHSSGAALPDFQVSATDWHGQRIMGDIPSASAAFVVESDVVVGAASRTAVDGEANFDSLKAVAMPGDYTLTISSDLALNVSNITASFIVRDCVPGEERHDVLCEKCSAGFFSVFPPEASKPCQACPKDGFCPGGSIIIPNEGYWHSTPFSVKLHKCLAKTACSSIDRHTFLMNYHKGGRLPSSQVVSHEDYPQCSLGHEGILCGTCSDGFGRRQGECRKCAGMGLSRFYMFVAAFWSLVILAITIRSAVVSYKEMELMKSFWARESNLQQVLGEEPLMSLPTRGYNGGEIGGIGEGYGDFKIPSELLGSEKTNNMIYQALFPSKPKNTIRRSQTPHTANVDVSERLKAWLNHQPKLTCGQECKEIRHVIAAENLSETLKIWVNYLQVTSLAAEINTEWTKGLLRMFAAQDILAGFSSAEGIVSPECVMDQRSNLRASVATSLVRIFFPICLYVFVAAIIIAVWLKARKNDKEEASRKGISRLMISLMAVLFFSYLRLSKEFMQSFTCLRLDHPDPDPETDVASEFAVARGVYWAEDTHLRCFTGEHRILTVIGSIGLVIVTLGAPLSLLALLLWLRTCDLLFDRTFMEKFGFLYQAYSFRTIYWEVLILLRKATIVAVVVFGHVISAQLQSILALGVLGVALIAHLLLQPFKYSHLNCLESVSLGMSIMTIYSAFIFQESNTSYGARLVVTLMVLVGNIAVFLVFLFRTLLQFDRFAESKLQAYKKSTPRNPIAKYSKFLFYFVWTSFNPSARERITAKCEPWVRKLPDWMLSWIKEDPHSQVVADPCIISMGH